VSLLITLYIQYTYIWDINLCTDNCCFYILLLVQCTLQCLSFHVLLSISVYCCLYSLTHQLCSNERYKPLRTRPNHVLTPSTGHTRACRPAIYTIQQQNCIQHTFIILHHWTLETYPAAHVIICLTLWRPLLPYGYSYKASSPECQSAQMSKITNAGLTQSATGCFIAVLIWQQWLSKG